MRIKQLLYLFLSLMLLGCEKNNPDDGFVIPEPTVLDKVNSGDPLNVGMQYSTTDYFVYQGHARGFHYEMMKDFLNYMGIDDSEITIYNNTSQAVDKLADKKIDMYAATVTNTPEREKKVLFSKPLFYTDMVVVQRADLPSIKKLEELDGKRILVQPSSLAQQFLTKIADSLDIDIIYDIIPNEATTEDILAKVNSGRADYTVVDGHIGRTLAQSMRGIKTSLPITSELPVAWAIDKDSPDLLEYVNEWIDHADSTGKLNIIYNKYYETKYASRKNDRIYNSISKGVLSPYDKIIKEKSKELGWDWRLVAALIYTESNFDAEARSPRGAYGLMQIMPETAKSMGVKNYRTVEGNIEAGVRYLKYLEGLFSPKVDSLHLVPFVLAAYNAGQGHILDAQRLAEKYKRNPKIWKGEVDHFILHKREPLFYKDDVVRHGYCDGVQVYNYVNKVLNTYDAYRHVKE